MEKISVKQNVNLYLSAISRHGQYVRWYMASKCYCASDMGRPDPSCKECLGRGHMYEPVKSVRRLDVGASLGNIVIKTKAKIKTLNRLFGSGNQDIPYQSFSCNEITLVSAIPKGRFYYVDYDENLELLYSGSATYEGRGILRVPIIGKSTMQGDFVGEISDISSVTNNTRSETMNAVDFWADMILTDSFADEGDDISVSCKYVTPVKFLISGINPKEKMSNTMVYQEADAQATVPGWCFIGPGDIITLLKAEQRVSVVGEVHSPDAYRLPFFKVKKILSIKDEHGEISDAVVIRNNEIKWGSRVPDGRFSISLTYNPSFVVLDDLPTPRHAEDKVFPRKLMLKQWDMSSRGNKRPISVGMNQEGQIY
jgi:hypothetical protein